MSWSIVICAVLGLQPAPGDNGPPAVVGWEPPAPAPMPVPAPEPAPVPTPTSDIPTFLVAEANRLRTLVGKPPLRWDARLASAAQKHANYLADYIGRTGDQTSPAGSHDGPPFRYRPEFGAIRGTQWAERLAAEGVPVDPHGSGRSLWDRDSTELEHAGGPLSEWLWSYAHEVEVAPGVFTPREDRLSHGDEFFSARYNAIGGAVAYANGSAYRGPVYVTELARLPDGPAASPVRPPDDVAGYGTSTGWPDPDDPDAMARLQVIAQRFTAAPLEDDEIPMAPETRRLRHAALAWAEWLRLHRRMAPPIRPVTSVALLVQPLEESPILTPVPLPDEGTPIAWPEPGSPGAARRLREIAVGFPDDVRDRFDADLTSEERRLRHATQAYLAERIRRAFGRSGR